MASASSALALLRTNPASAINRFGFVVESSIYTGTTLGGPCQLTCAKANDDVFTLTASAGQGDYFFPYINTHMGGVGTCQVPTNIPDGTLALTGGMNGCSLQVNKSGNNFHFYHDNNGNSMGGKMTPGEVVCRVDYKDYAGPLDIGFNLALSYNSEKSGGQYEYYCISVYNKGRWQVFVSSLIRVTKRKTSFWTGKDYNSIKFVPFNPSITKLMTSF